MGQLNGGARQTGGLAGRKGRGSSYRTESSGGRTKPEIKVCELSSHSRSCENGQDTPESLQRESEVTGGCGQSAEESPLDGLAWGGGCPETTDSAGCPPQRLPWHLPWRWAFPSPGCQPSPLPLESSSRTSNGVTKPSILLTDIQFTRPVMRIHFGGRQSCRWNSFSPEAHGVSCYTLALVDLSSIRKDWRVINAVELVIPPRAVRRVLKQVR